MKAKQVKIGKLSLPRRWALAAFLLLLAVMFGAQGLHWHTKDVSTESLHCTICHIAHAPAQAAPVASEAVVFKATALLRLSPDPAPKRGFDCFSRFCRPPPLA